MDDIFEPFNLEVALLGNTMRAHRAHIPRFTPYQVQTLLAHLHEKETSQIAALSRETKKAAMQNVFEALAADIHAATGTYPTRPTQCANVILSVTYMPILRAALAEYDRHPEIFITWYDYASGIAEVAGELCMAEAEIAGLAKEYTQKGIDLTGETLLHRPLPSSVAEKAYTVGRAKDKHVGQLLTKDPTGESIIAWVVDEVRFEAEHHATTEGMRRILPYQNPQLFLAGALYAQRLYTVLYPLSQ